MKSQIILSFAAILCVSLHIHGQSFTFQSSFGGPLTDMGHDAIVCSDGSILVTGASMPAGKENYDVYLSKLSATGEVLWQKTFGTLFEDGGNQIAEGDNGTFFIAGHRDITGEDACDALFFMIDEDGDTLWTTLWGFEKDDAAFGCIRAQDGNFISVGKVEIGENSQGFITKHDDQGNLLWDVIIGGPEEDYLNAIKQTENGYIISGKKTLNGETDFWLVNIDPSGNILWEKTLSHEGRDNAYGIAIASDGGFLLTGRSDVISNGTTSELLIRTDGLGNVVWQTNMHSSHNDYAFDALQNVDDNWLVTGTEFNTMTGSQDAFLACWSDDGSILWKKYYGEGGFDVVRCLHPDAFGGYIFCGYGSVNNTTDSDIEVYRVGADGNYAGISEPGEEQLLLYPNPASDVLHFVLEANTGGITVQVFDISGRLQCSIASCNSEYLELETTSMSDGIYFYTFSKQGVMLHSGAFEIAH